MIMHLKIERIFMKFDTFVLHPPNSLLLYLVPGSLSKNAPVRQSFSWETTRKSTTFHGCQGPENVTFWEETVTPWIPPMGAGVVGQLKQVGLRFQSPIHCQTVSTYMCKRSLLCWSLKDWTERSLRHESCSPQTAIQLENAQLVMLAGIGTDGQSWAVVVV